MLRLLGGLVGAGSAVLLGQGFASVLLILIVILVLQGSIVEWWPYMAGWLGYSLVAALVVGVLKPASLRTWVLLAAVLAPAVIIAFYEGLSWGSGLVALLFLLNTYAIVSIPETAATLNEKNRVVNWRLIAEEHGRLFTQNMWLGPLTVTVLSWNNDWDMALWAAIATLLGIILTALSSD